MHLHIRLNLELPQFAGADQHRRAANVIQEISQRIREDTGEIKGTVIDTTGDTLARYWVEH